MENLNTSDDAILNLDTHPCRSCLPQQACQRSPNSDGGCKGDRNSSGCSNNGSLGRQSPDRGSDDIRYSSFNNNSSLLGQGLYRRLINQSKQGSAQLPSTATFQFSFNFCTSSAAKTVHLLGSWDKYSGQLPLHKDKASSKAGAWKGTYKFMGTTLQAGQRYWYYYIIDGLYVSYDSAQAFIIERTTGRVLNILDVPFTSSEPSNKTSSSIKYSSSPSRREARAANTEIPKGCPLPASQIKSPTPISPPATVAILEIETAITNLTSCFLKTIIDGKETAITNLTRRFFNT